MADCCRTFSELCGKGTKLIQVYVYMVLLLILRADQVRAELERRGCKIRTSCNVQSVSTSEDGCVIVTTEDGSQEVFDRFILAVDAPDALRLLGEEATFDETRVLGAFQYVYR